MAPRHNNDDDDMHSSDIDAEGEEDYDLKDQDVDKGNESPFGGDSDMDAEGEEIDEDEDDDEVVGPVKRATRRSTSRRKKDDEESVSDRSRSDAGSDSDSSESAENEWDAASDAAEEAEEAEVNADQNRCQYCGEDEEHDPSDEFEEYLSCAVCGDHAHKQCARNASALSPEEDTAHWRCSQCVENGLEEDKPQDEPTSTSRRRSSVPKLTRDLLPQARGGIKPDSHSVFSKLILDDDPMDGSRSLRKRRSPEGDEELPAAAIRKRRRVSATSDPDTVVNVAIRGEGTNLDGALSGDDLTNEDKSSPRLRSRPRRAVKSQHGLARIVSRHDDDPKSLIIGIPASAASLDTIERNAQKKQRRRERDRERRARNNRAISMVEEEPPSHYPAIATTMYTNPFYAFPDRETDELKGKPYGGILTEAEADTSRTYPQEADREIFESARRKAEEEWRKKTEASNAETPAKPKASGPPSKIKCINFGGYEIDTWHAAPYPEEYSRNKLLYICEFCLKYMNSDFVAWRHKLKCPAKHPPGDEIYRSTITPPGTDITTTLSFFEVDGRRNPLYCQNLCLLAKLFLGSKTLYYDVEPFLFYVMTENDVNGCHFVGYFSKEKRSLGAMPGPEPHSSFDDSSQTQAEAGAANGTQANKDPALSNPGNNVSCILVLPVHMRRGFGKVLIEFSYLLTRVEGRTGSPEKPLSDMGLVSYRSYWRLVICKLLLRYKEIASTSTVRPPSVTSIAKETGMTPDDIISTLEALRFLVRDPVTKTYALRLDFEYMQEYVEKAEKKATITIDPDKLIWTPYVMGRPTSLFPLGEETTAPIQTKAPREETEGLPVQPEEGVQQAALRAKASSSQPAPVASQDVPIESISPTMRKKTPPPALTLSSQPSLLRDSPSRRSPRRQPETPNGLDNGYEDGSPSSATTSVIPPTRFEVFPPVPGMTAKRRPGRPFGSRSRRTSSTPYRRPNGSPATRPSASVRRTRSKLDTVFNGIDDEEEVDDALERTETIETGVEQGAEDVTMEELEVEPETQDGMVQEDSVQLEGEL